MKLAAARSGERLFKLGPGLGLLEGLEDARLGRGPLGERALATVR